VTGPGCHRQPPGPRRPRFPLIVLLSVGGLLLVAGTVSVWAGLTQAQRLRDLIPPEAIVDAPAVGGAVLALGVAALALGLVHIGLALMLRTDVPLAPALAATLTAALAVTALGSAIAAAVSVASRMGDPALLSGLAALLLLIGAAYGWTAAVIISRWRRPASPT
jgi:hypothetical protein